jgi:DNA invertase Pin-like site-specific DNA recombinase
MDIGYKRVSTREQSTDRQLEGIKLDEVFEDKVSGIVRERPNLNICIKMLRSGDVLHVHSVDRLARSLRDVLEILETTLAKGVCVHFHTENLIFSPHSDNLYHTFMLQIMGSVAQLERCISKSRQREGIAIAKERGTKSGKPFGKQPLDMRLREPAIELCKQGMNISQIARELKISRPSVTKLLS